MKLIVNQAGKFLLGVAVAAMILVFTGTVLAPAIRDTVGTIFPNENNFVVNETGEGHPTLTASEENVSVAIGSTVDLFANITAQSSDGEDISSSIKDDLALPVEERTKLFVYKLADDGTRTLQSNIDTLTAGEWAVFYILDDGQHVNTLRVEYTVS